MSCMNISTLFFFFLQYYITVFISYIYIYILFFLLARTRKIQVYYMMKINVRKTLMYSWIIFKARILETKTNKENLIDVYKIHTLSFVSTFKIHPPNVLSPVHIIVRSELRAIYQGHCDHWSVSAPHCDHSNFLWKK